MGRLALDVGNLAEYPELGTFVDLGNDGIEIVDGGINSFSVQLGAKFKIANLNFQPEGSIGLRYQSIQDQWDLFGKANVNITGLNYSLGFGESFEKPGMQWSHGELITASASIGGTVKLGDVGATFKDTGFAWDRPRGAWSVFGSLRVNVGAWIEGSLGTRTNPGLVIDTTKPDLAAWNLNELNIAFGGVAYGGFRLEEIRFGFELKDNSFSVVATCGVMVNGWGLSGQFRFKDMLVESIAVGLNAQIPIYGPVYLTEFNGSIKNIDINDLSKLTFTAQVGISVCQQVQVDIPIITGKYTLAQFVGTANLSPSGMRVQADGYILAKSKGGIGNSQWEGYLGQGSATVNLNWSKNEYYADVNMRLHQPWITSPFFDGRFEGRMTFAGNESAIRFKAKASLIVANVIPLVGGKELGSCSLFVNIVPSRQQFNLVAWYDWKEKVLWWEEEKSAGLDWDLWRNRYDVLWNRNDVRNRLGSYGQDFRPMSLGMVSASLEPFALEPLQAAFSLAPSSVTKTGFSYSANSSPVPESEVSSGKYVAEFRVDAPDLRASYRDWIQKLHLAIDPVSGVSFQPISVDFNPDTGKGSIGVNIAPLPGQYLPRGLTVKATLNSPIELAAFNLQDPSNGPDMKATWIQAKEYRGFLPQVGSDQDGNLIPGLDVTRARYSISFRPATSELPLPEDWAESVRIYCDPLVGASLLVGRPIYDQATNLWSIEVDCVPENSTTIGDKFLTPGLAGKITIRSKVDLVGETLDLGGMDSPDIHASWFSPPSSINKITIPSTIGTDLRKTTLSGKVHDSRITEVTVSLMVSLDKERQTEIAATLENGQQAENIVVPVGQDGTWSTEITWDPSKLPSGNLWVYGVVDSADLWQPVYSLSTPFELKYDIEGVVTTPANAILNLGIFGGLPVLPMPLGASGILVYADLNNNGAYEVTEPATHTDEKGHYEMNLPGNHGQVAVRMDLPFYFGPAEGSSSSALLDLSNGPVTKNFELAPLYNIIRGSVHVAGKTLGQPISGVPVIATDKDGKSFKAISDNDGVFEIPVGSAGDYQIRLDLENASYFDFQLRGSPDRGTVHVSNQEKPAIIQQLISYAVDSVGVVKRQPVDDEELFQGTLETLVREANEGYVTTIEFDSSLKNSTFELKTHNSILQPGYIAFNSETNQWTEVTPKLPLDRNGNPDDSILAGPTAFNILGDLTIDGGNLGITLKGDGTTRAFYIKPDVWFGLSNITLANFAANGAAGQLDNQNNLAQIPSSIGGSAGEGGAILNRGWTTLTNVNFSDNRSQGGVGSKSNQTPQILNTQEGLQNLSGDSLSDISLGISWDEDMPSGITIASPNSPGQSFNGGGYMGGVGGDAIPVTLTYTLGDDPTLRTATVMIAGAGGGGSGLGGAIYNAEDGTLIITGGSSFTANSVQAGKA